MGRYYLITAVGPPRTYFHRRTSHTCETCFDDRPSRWQMILNIWRVIAVIVNDSKIFRITAVLRAAENDSIVSCSRVIDGSLAGLLHINRFWWFFFVWICGGWLPSFALYGGLCVVCGRCFCGERFRESSCWRALS